MRIRKVLGLIFFPGQYARLKKARRAVIDSQAWALQRWVDQSMPLTPEEKGRVQRLKKQNLKREKRAFKNLLARYL
jgi:hypothetical protein